MVLASAVPVLLIRGLTREQRHWGQLRPMLAQQPALIAERQAPIAVCLQGTTLKAHLFPTQKYTASEPRGQRYLV